MAALNLDVQYNLQKYDLLYDALQQEEAFSHMQWPSPQLRPQEEHLPGQDRK